MMTSVNLNGRADGWPWGITLANGPLRVVWAIFLLAVVSGCRNVRDEYAAQETGSVCYYYRSKYLEMSQAILIPPEVVHRVRQESSRERRIRLLMEDSEAQLGKLRAIEVQVRQDRRPRTELDQAFLRLLEAVQESEIVERENMRYELETGVSFRTDKHRHRAEATAAADRAVQEADDEFVRLFIIPCPGYGLGG